MRVVAWLVVAYIMSLINLKFLRPFNFAIIAGTGHIDGQTNGVQHYRFDTSVLWPQTAQQQCTLATGASRYRHIAQRYMNTKIAPFATYQNDPYQKFRRFAVKKFLAILWRSRSWIQ